MTIQTVFNRYEKKYLLTEAQYLSLRRRLSPYMREDDYGLHSICNLYYDTEDNLLIRRSLEKPVYKEKLRLRSYGIPKAETVVFLEIKKKYRGVVNKRRVALPLCAAEAFLERGIRPSAVDSQILNELEFLLARYPLRGKLFLAYDRMALQGLENPDFRLTFDQNIRSRRTDLKLSSGDRGQRLFSEKIYLAESKVTGAAPLWFSRILGELAIYPQSFSKYGRIYQMERKNPRLQEEERDVAVPAMKERKKAC